MLLLHKWMEFYKIKLMSKIGRRVFVILIVIIKKSISTNKKYKNYNKKITFFTFYLCFQVINIDQTKNVYFLLTD